MIDAKKLYEYYLSHPIISTDSRQITPNCIFFALSGERFDGNDYVLDALNLGAAYAVVDNPELEEHPQLLKVEDTLLALQELAALHRAELAKPVIAITGTNGKTTTKELAASVLSKAYNVLYTEGNLNNHIGVPLTLLRLKAEHDFAIIEMGASKPGDIEELCVIAQPNYGIITNIGEAHLEGFKSIIGVERTKAELYKWLKEHDGKVIRKEEDERLTRLSQGIPAVTYGVSEAAVVRGVLSPYGKELQLNFSWEVPSIGIDKQEQKTRLVGDYNLDNTLTAIAVGLFFGVETRDIKQAIEDYTPQNNRSQYQRSEYNELIIDAYNANPTSMERALSNFLALNSEYPKLAILGDMNELGESTTNAHLNLYNMLKPYVEQGALTVIYCGPIWSRVLQSETVTAIKDVEALKAYITSNTIKERTILIKGSNGINLKNIVPLL